MQRLETWCQSAIYAMESTMFAIHFCVSKSTFQYKGENEVQNCNGKELVIVHYNNFKITILRAKMIDLDNP
jgi:hypothetical protein